MLRKLLPTYDPDAQRYFDQAISNGAAAGSTVWKASVNNLVVWMKSHSLWPTPSAGFDFVYLWTVPDTITGRVNLVFPSQKNLTISGTPTFVAYRSIAGNGTDAMLSTGVNHSGGGFIRTQQNATHISGWLLGGSSNLYSVGIDGGARLYLNHSGTPRVNATATVTDTGITTGLYAADRDNSADIDTFFNGAAKTVNGTSASLARQAFPVVLLKANTVFSSAEISMAGLGANLTAQQEADWYTGVRTFLLANAVAGVT